jgi:hypothetical protein
MSAPEIHLRYADMIQRGENTFSIFNKTVGPFDRHRSAVPRKIDQQQTILIPESFNLSIEYATMLRCAMKHHNPRPIAAGGFDAFVAGENAAFDGIHWQRSK